MTGNKKPLDASGMQEEDGVTPSGSHTAHALPNGILAEVRKDGRRVGRKFRGELAWADAVRKAGDFNSSEAATSR